MSSDLFRATTLKHINEKCDTNEETKISQSLKKFNTPSSDEEELSHINVTNFNHF